MSRNGRRLRFKAVSGPSNAGRPNDGVVYFTEERESRVTATSLGFVKGEMVFAQASIHYDTSHRWSSVKSM